MMSRDMAIHQDYKCGHKFDEHRQLEIINYCIGNDFFCQCEKYEEVKIDMQEMQGQFQE